MRRREETEGEGREERMKNGKEGEKNMNGYFDLAKLFQRHVASLIRLITTYINYVLAKLLFKIS